MSAVANLTPLVCNLAGNALQVGGSCFVGFGVLYGIKGISSTMTDTVELLPRYFEDPTKINEDFRRVKENPLEQIVGVLGSTGLKAVLIAGTVGTGVLLKRGGSRLASKQMIETLENLTSYTPKNL